MQTDLETRIRDAAPRVTAEPEAYLAALRVSDEAADSVRAAARARRRAGWSIGAAAVIAIAGTNIAAAATQTLWWSAPGQIVTEATLVPDEAGTVGTVSFVLAADYADGVDGNTADARAAFQLAQAWLVDHPIVVAVPNDASTLSAEDESDAEAAGIPAALALEQKAIQATQAERDAAIAAGHDALMADLAEYLDAQGADPESIIVGSDGGIFQVAQ